MLKKPTDELNSLLENMKPDDLDSYLSDNSKYLVEGPKAFYYYMKNVLDSKNIKLKDVYSFAGVSESYGSKIISQEKHTTDRDLIIRFCVAGHFTWDETSRALKLYGMNELYAKDPRDACLIVAIKNRLYSMSDIDELLLKQGFKKLTTDE